MPDALFVQDRVKVLPERRAALRNDKEIKVMENNHADILHNCKMRCCCEHATSRRMMSEPCAKLIDMEWKPCSWCVDYRLEGNFDELFFHIYKNLRERQDFGQLKLLNTLSPYRQHTGDFGLLCTCLVLFYALPPVPTLIRTFPALLGTLSYLHISLSDLLFLSSTKLQRIRFLPWPPQIIPLPTRASMQLQEPPRSFPFPSCSTAPGMETWTENQPGWLTLPRPYLTRTILLLGTS